MSAAAIAERLERLDVPRPLVACLRAVASAVRGSAVGGDVLAGRPVGHPLHPALVVGPLGAWTGAAALDLAGGRRARGASRRLVGAGVLLTVPAAAAGLDDWLDTSGPEQRVGALHAAVNVTAVAAYSLSWALRRRHHGAGVLVGLAGGAIAGAGGWIGGHLTYAMGVGVDTNAFGTGPAEWSPLGVDLPSGRMAGAMVDGVALAGTRLADGPAVLAGRCSHRGGPLAEGGVDGGCVTCPWHGSRFELRTGRVVRGPASLPQPVSEVREPGGAVEVRRREERSLRTNPV
ncbi:MAG: Rieske (2Fe-2S) protein [Acidimicrobiales bacterium]